MLSRVEVLDFCCLFILILRVSMIVYVIHSHAQIMHHANACIHSSILVTETPENEPIKPAETVEPKPGVELLVEPEEN
jgi:hypothetical protein